MPSGSRSDAEPHSRSHRQRSGDPNAFLLNLPVHHHKFPRIGKRLHFAVNRLSEQQNRINLTVFRLKKLKLHLTKQEKDAILVDYAKAGCEDGSTSETGRFNCSSTKSMTKTLLFQLHKLYNAKPFAQADINGLLKVERIAQTFSTKKRTVYPKKDSFEQTVQNGCPVNTATGG